MISQNGVIPSRDGFLPDGRVRFLPSLSVFFPAYNDAPSLPSLLDRTFETLRRAASDYEVIVVNDGSSDSTAAVLEQMRVQYAPFLRVVTHVRNLGYGAALRSGFAAASKEFVFYTDGDSQYDPAELENLLGQVTPATALVNGYKIERSDPWYRIAIGWLYNRFARWLFRIKVRDVDCDFRLIRRAALDQAALQSTGGTICIELVLALELSGAMIAEVPVHHYARLYGRSQFFRIRSLATTFLQLCGVYYRLVLTPALERSVNARQENPSRISIRAAALVSVFIVLLSILAYGRSFSLPFISDDYLQIQLARDYGPISAWPALAHDALYRCRATSLVLTYLLDRAVGIEPIYYHLASLLIHIANSLLVFALASWRPVGWRMAALAACIFAVRQSHSEAVVWFAAVPELLVFTCVLAGFLFWVRWLEAGQDGPQASRTMQTGTSGTTRASLLPYAGALGCFILGLLSKESAVVLPALCLLAVCLQPGKPFLKLWGLAPFALLGVAYFVLTYAGRADHQHFSDGTFSLRAPLFETLIRSIGRLFWPWGFVFGALLFTRTERRWRFVIPLAGAWILVSLLPYSFLTYMPRVPSRHTYLAGVGISLIIAVGLLALRDLPFASKKAWLTPCVMVVFVLHQFGYLWFFKHWQYYERAQPTEQLIRAAEENPDVIYANCFPYAPSIADYTLRLRIGKMSRPQFVTGPTVSQRSDAINFCNVHADGIHY